MKKEQQQHEELANMMHAADLHHLQPQGAVAPLKHIVLIMMTLTTPTVAMAELKPVPACSLRASI